MDDTEKWKFSTQSYNFSFSLHPMRFRIGKLWSAPNVEDRIYDVTIQEPAWRLRKIKDIFRDNISYQLPGKSCDIARKDIPEKRIQTQCSMWDLWWTRIENWELVFPYRSTPVHQCSMWDLWWTIWNWDRRYHEAVVLNWEFVFSYRSTAVHHQEAVKLAQLRQLKETHPKQNQSPKSLTEIPTTGNGNIGTG
jgi:hypothetical protein